MKAQYMEKEFEILDHTADIGIIAYGKDVKEAFANAAKGMFSLITNLDAVQEKESREIELTAPDIENLVVSWLNELIYLFDTENLLFARFELASIDNSSLKATVHGEKVDSNRHEIKMGIKAATYHMLEVEENDICRVRVLFDI